MPAGANNPRLAVAGGDHRANAVDAERFSAELNIFSDNTGIPRTTAGSNCAGDDKREERWQDHRAPALPTFNAQQRRGVF